MAAARDIRERTSFSLIIPIQNGGIGSATVPFALMRHGKEFGSGIDTLL
jgi:hypothetical protein